MERLAFQTEPGATLRSRPHAEISWANIKGFPCLALRTVQEPTPAFGMLVHL